MAIKVIITRKVAKGKQKDLKRGYGVRPSVWAQGRRQLPRANWLNTSLYLRIEALSPYPQYLSQLIRLGARWNFVN